MWSGFKLKQSLQPCAPDLQPKNQPGMRLNPSWNLKKQLEFKLSSRWQVQALTQMRSWLQNKLPKRNLLMLSRRSMKQNRKPKRQNWQKLKRRGLPKQIKLHVLRPRCRLNMLNRMPNSSKLRGSLQIMLKLKLWLRPQRLRNWQSRQNKHVWRLKQKQKKTMQPESWQSKKLQMQL